MLPINSFGALSVGSHLSWSEKFNRKRLILSPHSELIFLNLIHTTSFFWKRNLMATSAVIFVNLTRIFSEHQSFSSTAIFHSFIQTQKYFPTFFFSFIHHFSSCSFQSSQMCFMIFLLLVKYSIYLLIKTPFDLSTPYKNFRMQGI